MTSDAKIGLLLGLVFIFVIAFIINGLPNLRPQTTLAEVPMNSNTVTFPDQSVGIGGNARATVDQDWSTLADESEATETVDTMTEPAAPVAEGASSQPEIAEDQDVRFEALLPGTEHPQPRVESQSPLARIENLLDRFTGPQQGQREHTVSTVNMDVPTAAEPPAAVQTVSPGTAVRPAETVTRNAEQPKPSGTTTTRPPATAIKPLKIYVVGEGESLSTVAKNVYGPEEGNRYVNINRIYEFNKDVLKSVNEVKAGQKLVIPALPQPTVNPDKPSDVLRGALFEKVNTLPRRSAAQAPPSSQPVRWYTVQDGDNLWKIASSQLGAGARYDEIATLNADLLKDKEVLDVGMKIKLPLK